MKNVRIILPLVGAATVVAAAVVGFIASAMWALIVAAVGVLASLMILGWILIKTLQTVSQRLAGIIKQLARVSAVVETSAGDQKQISRTVEGGSTVMTGDMRRVLEDLTLASRSLTVPQAHFDQLLRTVSANTVRTEAALNDTLDEMRTIVSGTDPDPVEASCSMQEPVR